MFVWKFGLNIWRLHIIFSCGTLRRLEVELSTVAGGSSGGATTSLLDVTMIPFGNKDDCKFKEISPRQIGGLTNKNGDWLGLNQEKWWKNADIMKYSWNMSYEWDIRGRLVIITYWKSIMASENDGISFLV